jgi:hypothetical protein
MRAAARQGRLVGKTFGQTAVGDAPYSLSVRGRSWAEAPSSDEATAATETILAASARWLGRELSVVWQTSVDGGHCGGKRAGLVQ